MIKSEPPALPSCCVSTHSLTAIVAYSVEFNLPATPAILGESGTLRLPLSFINGDAPVSPSGTTTKSHPITSTSVKPAASDSRFAPSPRQQATTGRSQDAFQLIPTSMVCVKTFVASDVA